MDGIKPGLGRFIEGCKLAYPSAFEVMRVLSLEAVEFSSDSEVIICCSDEFCGELLAAWVATNIKFGIQYCGETSSAIQ